MRTYIIRRLILAIPTIFVVSVVVFFLVNYLPGDAALVKVSEGGRSAYTPEQYERAVKELRLDDPWYQRYGGWVGGLFRGDGGKSLISNEPVFSELRQKIPVTVELAVMAMVLGLALSVPIGVLSAVRQDSVWDYGGRLFATVGLALPEFLAGSMLLLTLSLAFNWAPQLVYTPFFEDPLSNLEQFVFPAVILAFHQSAILVRMTRSAMLEVLRQDYMRTAYAKGLRPAVSIVRHALRNAFLPVITIAGIQAANMLGGSVIVERLFSLPGIGAQVVQGLEARDWTVVQTVVLLITIVIVGLNIALDVLYAWFDPRIRYQ